MGGGSYNLNTSKLRSSISYQNVSLDSNISDLKRSGHFSNELHKELNPSGVIVRESRDSEEHPNSVAVLLGLDVTGSMGSIPAYMLKEGLNHSIELLFNAGIKDPQLGIIALGDVYSDRVPLQISQFESSDELIDKCLKNIYPEGNGGGNFGESYNLAWYHAMFHTDIDCYNKRKQKGLLITMGDEACHATLPGSIITLLYNASETTQDYTNVELLKLVQEKYVVKHIHICSTSQGSSKSNQDFWKNLLDENVIFLEDHTKISEALNKIINNYVNTNNVTVENNTAKSNNSKKEEVVNDWD